MRINVIILAMLLALSGCTIGADYNPAFPLREAEAREIMRQQIASPHALERPVVVLAGYQDPGVQVLNVARVLRRAAENPGHVIAITYFMAPTFDECRQRVIDQVNAAFPTDDPSFTTEVDVVGVSMGGIVARHAARDTGDGSRRLRIRRLFTIGTPHQGARLAKFPTMDQRQVDMRPRSKFISELNADATSQDFDIIAYAYLDDEIVGARYAAPPGRIPWWLPEAPFRFAHTASITDARILADISQRLRRLPPFTIGVPQWPERSSGENEGEKR